MQYAFLPVFLFVVCALGLAVGLLIVSGFLNPGRPGRVTRMPYESGMDPIHDTRRRFDVRFHLLAIAFLIFDVELLFLYPWAVAVGGGQQQGGEWRGEMEEGAASGPWPVVGQRSSIPHFPLAPRSGIDAAVAAGWVESRHMVFGGVMTFLALLTLGYVYDWRKGVFQWR
jgi:NADH-quinone oxidoreductase subunit A